MGKQIVVTGAAGFIGCNIVAELNARGMDDLLLVDTLGTDEKWRNLLGLRFADMLLPEQFLKKVQSHCQLLQEVDCIIHMGACSATTEKNADYLLTNNFQYTLELCRWCLDHDVRFIYASSAATYGDGSQGYSDANAITPTLKPLNMYGYSKQMFDLWALQQDVFDRIVGLKFFNIYGPHEDHKGDMRSVVQKAYHQIVKEGQVSLFKSHKPGYADGEQMRDFVYVKDAVDVTLHFVENRYIGGLFNCGTGKARTWKDLVTAVFAAMGLPANINFIDMPQHLQEKYQYFTEAEISRLRGIGYNRPFTSLEEAVKDYVQNYLARQEP